MTYLGLQQIDIFLYGDVSLKDVCTSYFFDTDITYVNVGRYKFAQV